jgi:hypothetical protein
MKNALIAALAVSALALLAPSVASAHHHHQVCTWHHHHKVCHW